MPRRSPALLIEGLTSKLIGKRLAISPRTVDVYRARLMRKVGAARPRPAGQQAAQRLSAPRSAPASAAATARRSAGTSTGLVR